MLPHNTNVACRNHIIKLTFSPRYPALCDVAPEPPDEPVNKELVHYDDGHEHQRRDGQHGRDDPSRVGEIVVVQQGGKCREHEEASRGRKNCTPQRPCRFPAAPGQVPLSLPGESQRAVLEEEQHEEHRGEEAAGVEKLPEGAMVAGRGHQAVDARGSPLSAMRHGTAGAGRASTGAPAVEANIGPAFRGKRRHTDLLQEIAGLPIFHYDIIFA